VNQAVASMEITINWETGSVLSKFCSLINRTKYPEGNSWFEVVISGYTSRKREVLTKSV
jgi:hypothetical protein